MLTKWSKPSLKKLGLGTVLIQTVDLDAVLVADLQTQPLTNWGFRGGGTAP